VSELLIKLKSKIKHASYRLRSRKEKFKKIYEEGGFSGKELPLSGAGSTLEQTKRLRDMIPEVLKGLKAKSLLDAPCGDFTWMREIDLGGISYIGVDIVDEIIEKNISNYSGGNIKFAVADIVKDELPKADVILCRDCFVHLSNKDIVRALRNFKISQSSYLLTTTFYKAANNRDLVSGRGWRPVNLVARPFNSPPPLKLIIEGCTEFDGTYYDKSLGLWKLSDLSV
jgi:SAM-dependent methyltransferase